MGYTRHTISGILWISLLRGITRLITFVRLAILGRLLTPLEFGFYGIASLILTLLEIITETGINVFLVQHKGNIREYVSSAFVVSIIRGIILCIIIFTTAGLVSKFFNAPGAVQVIALTAIIPLMRGFINPAIVTFQKNLLFHKEFGLRSFLFMIDAFVSIFVGFITRSASSFVWGMIASAFIEVILSYVLIPIWPKLSFEYKKVRHVILRGWWITLTGIFSYVADNGDNLVVGKLLGSSSLGIYQVAYKFSTLPISEVTNVINQVIFPVYSKFPEDKIRLNKAFRKVAIVTSIAALVLGTIIFIFAYPIVIFVMGEQWVLAVPAIKILAIYGILRTLFGSFSPLFLALGRQDLDAKMTFVRAFGVVAFIAPLVSLYGMVGAGYAMLISVLIQIPVILYFTSKILKSK